MTNEEYAKLPASERKKIMLSPHFSAWECECNCGCGFHQVTQKQLAAMEAFRALVKKPVLCNSVCRCVRHNHHVGGGKFSRHLSGQAADIRVNGMTPHQMYLLALLVPAFDQGGIGIYDTFLHVDTGHGNNRPGRWDYRTKKEAKK